MRRSGTVWRTLVVWIAAGAFLAFGWLRLEEPREGGRLAVILLLALTPAFLPRTRWRLVASVPALLLAASAAFDDPPRDVVDRAETGLRSFYDVSLPFDSEAHPEMHGLVLLAVFVFTLAVSLAVAERRAISATGAFVAVGGAAAPPVPPAAPPTPRGRP